MVSSTYLDKGASLGPDAVPDSRDGVSLSYAEVQDCRRASPRPWRARGCAPGDKVAILSANDPDAFTCVFGIARAGAVWCPINPRNEAAENRELLDLFDCSRCCPGAFAPLVAAIRDLPGLPTVVCLDGEPAARSASARAPARRSSWTPPPATTSR